MSEVSHDKGEIRNESSDGASNDWRRPEAEAGNQITKKFCQQTTPTGEVPPMTPLLTIQVIKIPVPAVLILTEMKKSMPKKEKTELKVTSTLRRLLHPHN